MRYVSFTDEAGTFLQNTLKEYWKRKEKSKE
jgi:hypothetical protein